MSDGDLSESSLLDLFRAEAESQAQVLTSGLLALERNPTAADQLEACMRAAHSLKGAARIVGVEVAVGVAHALEDCFVAAQHARIALDHDRIDLLLRGVDLLGRLAQGAEPEPGAPAPAPPPEVAEWLAALARALAEEPTVAGAPRPLAEPAAAAPDAAAAEEAADRVLRVTAEHLDQLLGLAGEALVESRWLKPFAESLLRLRRLQRESSRALDVLRDALSEQPLDERARTALADAQRRELDCQLFLSQRLVELELFDRRSANLSRRLYDEAVACRMRPFADGARRFPRMVRDLARTLGKRVRLEIVGDATPVDRDILEKLDAPLGHLLRNAVDHGIESPEERRAAGKPPEGQLRLEARHSAGTLHVIVTDDGRGVSLDELRATIVARKLTTAEAAAGLSDAELLDFLFLPGLSLKRTVTEISGRGVGLDVVRDMISGVRGTVRVWSQPGSGMRFQLQLPVTLSIVRALLVEVGGEPYALPLGRVVHALRLPVDGLELLEGRQHIRFDGRQLGLVAAQQLLYDREIELELAEGELPVVVVGDEGGSYGLVVDRFLGIRDLVVQPLPAQLGKVQDVSSAALMEDGSPVLIIDADDLLRSLDRLVAAGGLSKVHGGAAAVEGPGHKRVLVVDDSLAVRELERKLLGDRGYEVQVAVDGMDAWNALRTGRYDLVVTDVDMPRMDGIELVTRIRRDPRLRALPVMVVSYKDREEDRNRGLEAGADHYLTKGSFHDESLLQAVVDLIGEAEASR